MAWKPLTDTQWETIKPLLPPHAPRPKGGRKPVDDRLALDGILFIFKTGLAWEDLSAKQFGCSGMTCWRRLRDWHKAGVWTELHRTLLSRLHAADKIDWSRALVDASSVKAVLGGPRPARTRRIAAKKAANFIFSPMPKAFRSPPR